VAVGAHGQAGTQVEDPLLRKVDPPTGRTDRPSATLAPRGLVQRRAAYHRARTRIRS
jgi:hypothetical protein